MRPGDDLDRDDRGEVDEPAPEARDRRCDPRRSAPSPRPAPRAEAVPGAARRAAARGPPPRKAGRARWWQAPAPDSPARPATDRRAAAPPQERLAPDPDPGGDLGPDHRQSPRLACQSVIAATAAVSARSTRGPSVTRRTKGRARSRAASSGAKPPRGRSGSPMARLAPPPPASRLPAALHATRRRTRADAPGPSHRAIGRASPARRARGHRFRHIARRPRSHGRAADRAAAARNWYGG